MRAGLLLLISLVSPVSALDVFILDDGDSNTDDLVDELSAWGHTVTVSSDSFSVTEDGFTGAERGLDLADYDAVVWLDGSDATFEEMPSDGLDTLLEYVHGGGGLLLFGATGYQYEASGYYGDHDDLVPLRSENYTTSKTWTAELAGHPLATGYGSGETFEPDSGLIRDGSASSGAVVFTFERSGEDYDAGIADELSDGRLVQFALWGNTTSTFTAYETNWTDGDVSLLVENALQWLVQRPPEVTLDATFTVAAEGSLTLRVDAAADPDGGLVSYAWDLGDDGTTDCTTATCLFDAAGYDGPESEPIRLTVTDDEGQATAVTATVSVTNVAPVAAGISGGDSLEEGTSGSFSLDFDDVEGADSHSVSWSFGDGEVATGSSTSHAWQDDGRFTITATVTDDDGGTDSLTISQVVVNVAPTLSGDPATTAWQGAEYRFEPEVSDPGADDSFTFDGSLPDGAALDTSTGVITWTPTADQLGVHSLLLAVEDDDGGGDSLSWEVEVVFEDSDGDGMPDDWEDGYGLDPDDAADAASDEDGDGRSSLDEYEGGTDPTLYEGPGQPVLVSPADGAELASVPPTLQVQNAAAPLDQLLTYNFAIYADEALTELVGAVDGRLEGSDGTTEWPASGVPLDENTDYWWTSRAADGYVEGAPAAPAFRFFVNEVNEAPGSPGISSPFEGGIVQTLTPELVLTAAVDPDRDTLSYRAEVQTPEGAFVASLGGLSDDGATAAGTLATSLSDDTEYCWTAVAIDPDGLESDPSPRACFFVDLSNEAPTAPVILSPEQGSVVSETLPTITVEDGVDPEGRATIHEFQVDLVATFDSAALQGGSVATDSDGRTTWTPTAALAEDSTWFVRVRCNDGGAASTWTTGSFLVSADPSAPGLPTLVSPENGAQTQPGQVDFTIDNALDPEGDALSYDFVVLDRLGNTVASAEGLASGAGTETTWTAEALADGVYTWTARAVDDGGQASDWAPVWIFAVEDGVVGAGDGGEADDTGTGLEAEGTGCSCTTGGASARPGAGLVVGLLGLLGLARRRSPRWAGPDRV